MMRGLGQGVKEFKNGMNDVKAPQEETDAEEGEDVQQEEAVTDKADGKSSHGK